MTKNPRYYSLKRALVAAKKASRGKASVAVRILDEMRVREYMRYTGCGLREFGLKYDFTAQRLSGSL